MRVRGGSPTLWRKPGESQVGADPGLAVVLTGLSAQEQRLVDHLGELDTASDLTRAARRTRVRVARARALVEILAEAGVLTMEDERGAAGPDEAYWDRLGYSPSRRSGALAASVVGLHGHGELVSLTAHHLARAGVGAILFDDENPDGRRRLEDELSAASPSLKTRAPLHTRPDIVVVVGSGANDPLRVRRLLQESLLHLPVVVGEVSIQVGPLVVPGRTACATCLELWRRDADPCWPVLAAQLTGLGRVDTERLLAYQAAATTARAVLDQLTGLGERWEGRSLHLSGLDIVPEQREWDPHPDCGCLVPPK